MPNALFCLYKVTLCCILFAITQCGPLRDRRNTGKSKVDYHRYLTDKGYLRRPDSRAAFSLTGKVMKKAIKMFQAFAGIPETGEVDNKTIEMMLMPRCGMPDFKESDNTKKRRKRYSIQGSKWRKKELTYMIVEDGPSNAISIREVEEQVIKAFQKWENVSTLKFTKDKDPNSDIIVKFRSGEHGDGYPFDGPGGTLAHGFYPLNNQGFAGDVHFDDEETWILKEKETGTDFFWTALHEIGHALGLEHSRSRKAIMYPFYTGFKENLELDADDIKGIQFLYGVPKIEVETVAPTEPMTTISTGVPNVCTIEKFDAVFANNEKYVYFFSGKYFWILPESGGHVGPIAIKDDWKELPEDGIDAAYYSNEKTTFFKNNLCWIYNGTKLLAGPIDISKQYRNLGTNVQSIDAAFVWRANGMTYLFSGDKYWRYNEGFDTIDMGYPIKINVSWVGVPNELDAALTLTNGSTYFFKGRGFWEFDNLKMRTIDVKPSTINDSWIKCSLDKNAHSGFSYISPHRVLILWMINTIVLLLHVF